MKRILCEWATVLCAQKALLAETVTVRPGLGILTSRTGRHMMDGTARIVLAELLFPVTALITISFLARKLGPQAYGVLALTLTTIIWIESAVASFFFRATIKFVGEMTDWRPAAAMIARLSLVGG